MGKTIIGHYRSIICALLPLYFVHAVSFANSYAEVSFKKTEAFPYTTDKLLHKKEESEKTAPFATADLELAMTANTPDASPGATIIFTLEITNDGPDDATGVSLFNAVPAGYAVTTVNNGGVLSGTDITWSGLSIPSSTTTSVSFEAFYNEPTGATDEYLNIAEITASDQPDSDSTPNNDDGDQSEDDEASFQVDPIAVDVEMNMSVNDTNPNVGDVVTFTIALSNLGLTNANGVFIQDMPASGYANISNVSNGGIAIPAFPPFFPQAQINWSGLTIPTGTDTLVLTFDAEVQAPTGSLGEYLNVAEVFSVDEFDLDSIPGNDDGDQSEDDEDNASIVPQEADLSITKNLIVGSTTPSIGSTLTFEIAIANAGPDAATNVTISDILPSGFSIITSSISDGGFFNGVGGDIRWNLANVPMSGVTLTYDVVVNQPTGASDEYMNTAQIIAADQYDPDSEPNNDDGDQSEDDEGSFEVTPLIIDLELELSVNDTNPNVDDAVTFTIEISNLGNTDAIGVFIQDILPVGYANITNVSNGGIFIPAFPPFFPQAQINWSGLTIPEGSKTVSLSFDAEVQAPTGTLEEYINRAEVFSADEFDIDSSPGNDDGDQSEDDEDNATLVPQQADLSITKSVDTTTPNVGDTVTFTLTIANAGPDVASQVSIQDILPAGYTLTAVNNGGVQGGNTATWSGLTIPTTGSDTQLTYEATVVAPTGTADEYLNQAQIIASDQYDPDSNPDTNRDIDENGDGNGDDDDEDSLEIVPNQSDLSLTKIVVDNSLSPPVGSQIAFEIAVTNDGPIAANTIEVTDVLPSGFSFVSANNTAGSYDNTTGVWQIATLANGATETLTINVLVNTSGDYTNTAEITASDTFDPDSTPNNNILTEDDQDEVTVTPESMVDVSVTKTADTMSPLVGEPIVFTITAANAGPGNASNLIITDILETGYTFVSANPSLGTYDAATGEWSFSSLSSGASETLIVTATVLATGIYANTAELTALSPEDSDSVAGNGIETEDDQQTIIPVPVPVSDLELRKAVDNLTPLAGSNVVFTISLTNNGPNEATGVAVRDALPSGYSFVSNTSSVGSFNSDTGIWELNTTVLVGATETLDIVARVNSIGDYFNVAEVVASDNPDPNSTPDNNTIIENDQDVAGTTPVPIADLSLIKSVDNPTPMVGDIVTFTIAVTNEGPSDATGVVVQDLIPDGYTYVSDDALGNYDPITGLWDVSTLATSSLALLSIQVSVNPEGNYNNVAEVFASGQFDPDSTPNNNAPGEDDIDGEAIEEPMITDVSVVITADDVNPFAGDQVVFTITVTNDGPGDASSLAIQNSLLPGLQFVSANPSSGTYNNALGLWELPTLLNSTSQTLEVTARVLGNGIYTAIAELTALDTFDPDSEANNNEESEDDQSTITLQPEPLADLSIDLFADNVNPEVGAVVQFTVLLTNGGISDATDVEVTTELPVGLTYQSHIASNGTYNPSTGIWETDTALANGSTENLILLALVNATTGVTDEYTNVVFISSSGVVDPDSDPLVGFEQDDLADGLVDDDEASLNVSPQTTDISLSKTVDFEQSNIGDQVVFTIRATNGGLFRTTNIGIEEQLPSGYSFISSQTSTGTYDETANFWEIESLESGETAELNLTVTVLDIDDYLNRVQLVFVDQPDLNPSNDIAEANVEISCLNVFNEFSPNGDGVNDFFVINCISRFPNNSLKIYNRWGNLVFQDQGYNNQWSGESNVRSTLNPELQLPVGTYYYVLELGDGTPPRTDWIYINR